MKIMQVKRYHCEIAGKKEEDALNRWREKKDGYGYPVKSMFYFSLSDNQGHPTTLRQKGYIAFNEHSAVYGKNPTEAKKRFTE